jgi:carbamoyltransferase
MRVLSVNSGHHSSIAYCENGEIRLSIETERLNKIKYSEEPFEALRTMLNQTNHIDYLGLAGMSKNERSNSYETYIRSLRKGAFESFFTYDSGLMHHKMHASTAFYNSGFDKALIIVSDGMGSEFYFDTKEGVVYYGREHTSTYIMSYPANIKCVNKKVSFPYKFDFNPLCDNHINISNHISEGEAFSVFAVHCGFGVLDAGKIMGLSSYGKPDDNIPPIYVDGKINNELFVIKNNSLHTIEINVNKYPYLKTTDFQILANFAYALQTKTQEHICNYIASMVSKEGISKVCLTGGYFLNCVTNAYIRKNLPDIELYVEPISSDSGTSIGTSKFIHHTKTKDMTIRPQTSIYYGLIYDYTLEQIKSKLTKQEKIIKTTAKKVANIISNNNIVLLYQGRSENGPRALGNRSLLYNPMDTNGKDKVNIIKQREKFRPFAGTVLQEKAKDWFEMLGMKESPFMMYALNVKKDKIKLIPAITHVDNTCRIQTVNSDQNKHFYNLISEFEKITGVPILFNTSLNLAGDPMAETIDDVLKILRNTKIEYLYLPELNSLITK